MTREELFPEIEPKPGKTGMLKVSDTHRLYYEEVGNPNGQPIVFLHGGPGAGISPQDRRFFDPDHYRIILFDQRGSGKSEPFASMEDNDTWHIISDIEKLREHLEIDTWHVFGGSWGSTLALTYAEKHTEVVTGLILRGIFLGGDEEVKWLFQEGASEYYPKEWQEFIKLVPEEERDDIIGSYDRMLSSGDEEIVEAAAYAFVKWEISVSSISNNEVALKDLEENPKSAIPFAKAEARFLSRRCFMDHEGHEHYLKENLHKLADIPMRIVHGRFDMVCRPIAALELDKLCTNAVLNLTNAGHSSRDPETIKGLVAATEEFKSILGRKNPTNSLTSAGKETQEAAATRSH